MTTYRIGFHKNNLPGRADSMDEARKIAVKIYNDLSPLDKNVAGTRLHIYRGQKEYARVYFEGGNGKWYYHVNYSSFAPRPFNPKTGKLMEW